MADHPLVLPPDFDPERQMVARQVDGKTFHAMQTTARLAGRLAANGTDDDWRRVGPIVASLLECQHHERPIAATSAGNGKMRRSRTSMRCNSRFFI